MEIKKLVCDAQDLMLEAGFLIQEYGKDDEMREILKNMGDVIRKMDDIIREVK